MIDPAYALQVATTSTLSASNAVTAMGATIYDRVPSSPSFPFIQLGQDDVRSQDYQFSAESVCTVNVHIYSRAENKTEVKQLAAIVRDSLETYLPITGFMTVTFSDAQTKYLVMDGNGDDGQTEHAVFSIDYSVRPN